MDRLPNLLTTKELLRAAAILALSLLAAYLLAPIIVGIHWRGFLLAMLGTGMPLVWTAFLCMKNMKREAAIRAAQLKEIGELESIERLPFGVLGVRADGIGVTYFPMTEFFVRWEEIKSATYCQFGQVRRHVTNQPGTDQPRIRSWSKPVIIVQTTRTDFPKFPLIFDTASSADRWIDILERQRPPETVFHLNRLPWKNRFTIFELTVSLVGLVACGISLAMDHFPGVKGSYDRGFPVFIACQMLAVVASMISAARETGSVAILQTFRPDLDEKTALEKPPLYPVAGALWITEEFNCLERIPLDLIKSIDVKLKKSEWASDIFKPRKLNRAELTLHLDRNHDATRTFQLNLLGAQASIAALLAERPDIYIQGPAGFSAQSAH